MNDDRPSGTQTLRSVERLVADRLPPGWSLSAAEAAASGRGRPRATWTIRSPDGATVEFAVRALRSMLPRDLPEIVQRMRPGEALPLIAAPYLSQRAQEVLTDLRASYGDSTGNLRLVADRPALFFQGQGATKDPWPSNETLQSLRGRGAGRAVRAVIDFRAPFGVRDLAQRASVPLGSLSRVIGLLDREGLLTRSAKGAVADVSWAEVIRRWSRDYEFRRSNHVATYLEPRSLGTVVTKLSQAQLRYAATGALAAQRFAPVAPARTAALYIDDIAQAAARLDLRPVDTGSNVWLAEPFDPVVFDRTTTRAGLTCVAPSQLAVDLLTGPGREPSEGEELLVWMKENERAWRS